MSVVVSKLTFCGGYIGSFTATTSPDGGQLIVRVFDSKADGITTSPPATGSLKMFNYGNFGFSFLGAVQTVVTNPETATEPKSYTLNLTCNQDISNLSDTIVGLYPYNINVIYTAKLPQDVVVVEAYGYSENPPNSNYGSFFEWNISTGSDDFSLNAVLYKSYIRHPYNAPNGSPLYKIDGSITPSAATQNIVIYSSSENPSAVTDPNADTSPPITIITPPAQGSTGAVGSAGAVGSSTTTQTNDYGAGSVIIKYPNNGTVPVGTTVTTSSSDGLTSVKTIYANSSEVTETTLTTFSPSRNVASQNIAQKQQAFNQPASFQGSIDPTKLFPSIEIYPSSTYLSDESGKFFGLSASPTSFDLDPYFYFSKNDYGLVAKDGKSNSKNINVKKDNIKDHVRTMGLKGPMYYSGWGYDARGLPVPNDGNAIVQTGVNSKGQPVYGTDPRGAYKFHSKTPVERKLWKTGPVDLRWHDKKKTWVGGQEMLEGYLLDDLDSPESISEVTSARMSVFRIAVPGGALVADSMLISPASGLYNQNGVQTGVVPAKYGPEYITISNRDPSLSASSGSYCMAVDINYEWRPIYIGC